jgi:large-conductance mechanosensitive channel
MKKLTLFLFISNFAFAQTSLLDTNSILIGEQINFTISNTISKTEAWPTFEEFLVKGVEIIEEGKLDTSENLISQNFIITAWDSGSYYIPPISFSVNSKTEGLLLNVQTVILEEGAELKDIKQPMLATIGWSDIWPWLLAFIVLALVIFLLKKYVFNKKEKERIEKPKVITPADITALKQLTKLEKAQLWQGGGVKEYHSELSEIIRRYTENRFNFIALELATDEIISELKSKVNNEQLASITILLQRADLAKFAKSKPDEDDNKESMQLAKHFVEQTKEKK